LINNDEEADRERVALGKVGRARLRISLRMSNKGD